MTSVVLETGMWVLVGDGEKALFFRNQGDATYPKLEVVKVLEHDNPRTSEQGSDRPGRAFASTGAHRSALQETDWHRLEKHRFAKEIADMLHEAAQRGRFSKLVVVAPPVTMGELRKEMHADVARLIVAEVTKDLTHLPAYEIEKALTHAGS